MKWNIPQPHHIAHDSVAVMESWLYEDRETHFSLYRCQSSIPGHWFYYPWWDYAHQVLEYFYLHPQSNFLTSYIFTLLRSSKVKRTCNLFNSIHNLPSYSNDNFITIIKRDGVLEWTANKNQISFRPLRRFRMKTLLCRYPLLSRCRTSACAYARRPIFPSRRIAAYGWHGHPAIWGRTLPRIWSFLSLLCQGCPSCVLSAASWCSTLAPFFSSSIWSRWNLSFRLL